MKKELQQYLRDIGVTMALDSRIEEILGLYAKQLGGEPEDILVSEYVTSDGTREYESLWFFSKKYVGEAKEFIKDYNVDITPIESRIRHLRFTKLAYDFQEATSSSRLSVQFSIDSGISGQLKASGKNCDYLRDILAKYLRPNMKQMAQAV